MNLKNLTIMQKMAIPTVLIAVLVVVGNIYAILTSQNLANDSRRIQETFISAIDLGLNADRDLYQALTASNELIESRLIGVGNFNLAKDNFYENATQAYERMQAMRSLIKGYPHILRESSSFESDYQSWFSKAEEVIKLTEEDEISTASALHGGEARQLFEVLRKHYDVSVEAVKAEADILADRAQSTSNQLFIGMLAMLIIVVIASGISSVIGPKLITSRVNMLVATINQLCQGEGDLKSRLDASGKDELATLARAFNGFLDSLQQLVAMIKDDSKTMDGTVATLNQSAVNNNEIVSVQNDNLTQIASAVNELSHSVHEIAGNAQTAQSETTDATETAMGTKVTVDDTVSKITGLSSTVSSANTVISNLASESANIVQVLDVIKGIAEQTNLLALNAAIEAARAGEQGRGFAVVADEVRTLASRTQQSTQDIQNMLSSLESGVTQAVSAMEAGSNQMDEVSEQSKILQSRLETLTAAITKTGDIIIQIASATEEQSYVTDEITRNVTNLNDLSDKIVDNAKDTEHVSKTMSDMAAGINQKIGKFKV